MCELSYATSKKKKKKKEEGEYYVRIVNISSSLGCTYEHLKHINTDNIFI